MSRNLAPTFFMLSLYWVFVGFVLDQSTYFLVAAFTFAFFIFCLYHSHQAFFKHLKYLKGVRVYPQKWQNGSLRIHFTDFNVDHLRYDHRIENTYYCGFLRFELLYYWLESIHDYEQRIRGELTND